MSNHHLEKQLELVINLLETLPIRMCDEMEKRHEIRKAFQCESEIEFYAENHEELKKFMSGFKDYKLDDHPRAGNPMEVGTEKKCHVKS